MTEGGRDEEEREKGNGEETSEDEENIKRDYIEKDIRQKRKDGKKTKIRKWITRRGDRKGKKVVGIIENTNRVESDKKHD